MPADPPLLSNDESPNLGGAQVELEQSPLERLIQQSTSEQRQGMATTGPFFLEERVGARNSPSFSLPTPEALVTENSFYSKFVTLVAGSFCLFHMGLVWASFLSENWFETHLILKVDWKTPFFDGSTDQLLHTTTLASLMSTFLAADLHWATVALVMASLVVPCLSMIVCAAWTVGDYQKLSKSNSGPRSCFEYILRGSLVTFFAFTILDAAASCIDIDMLGNTETVLQIANKTNGGLVCYTLGTICALLVIGVLRMRQTTSWVAPITNNFSSNRPVPPDNAFQLPWRNYGHAEVPEQRRPLLSNDDSDEFVVAQESNRPTSAPFHTLSFCQRVVLYEVGICATVLLIPAYFLPLFTIEFSGLASEFMMDSFTTITFFDFPMILKHQALAAETENYMVVAFGSVLIGTVYVLPLLVTLLSMAAWKLEPSSSHLCKKSLFVLQPFLCGIVFAAAVVACVPAFEPIGRKILENKTSGICTQFQNFTNDTCLTIDGELGIGVWFLMAQSIALELFVVLSCCWI